MLWGGANGGLELRNTPDGGVALTGVFPYGEEAVLSDGGRSGRPLVETIEARAFSYRVGFPDAKNIHLLHGHSFEKPLASVREKTLMLTDTEQALKFEAVITPTILRTQYAQDAIAQIESGLATGISPGFRLPPERVVPRHEAEVIERQEADLSSRRFGATLRKVKAALLYELSVVTRPAYHAAQIEARNWQPVSDVSKHVAYRCAANRWR